MEGPTEFDVCARIDPNERKAAVAWTARLFAISNLEAYKSIDKLLTVDAHVQIFAGCGWDDIPQLRKDLPTFARVDSVVITESSYPPSLCSRYCEVHSLKHGCPDCPVCEGNYISRVVDGKKIGCT